uniref:C2H2-type domain-containing protein n=1 Tax=Neogobius melanostomus TaxID=47308 RepID=A0A8C6WQ08_9GOBI
MASPRALSSKNINSKNQSEKKPQRGFTNGPVFQLQAIPVPNLQKHLLLRFQPETARAQAHGRETLRLRPVWGDLQTHVDFEEPPPEARPDGTGEKPAQMPRLREALLVCRKFKGAQSHSHRGAAVHVHALWEGIRIFPRHEPPRSRPHRRKDYVCDICGKAFNYSGNLAKHKRLHLGQKSQQRNKKFTCEDCGKGFSDKSNLIHHRLVHTGEKAYQCEDCGVRFARAGCLARHRRRHTGERPYELPCDECGEVFYTPGDCTHVRTHTGEKPYRCQSCDYACSSHGNLRRHQRTHAEQRKHKKSTGKRSMNLKRHMLRHTGHKPYECDACSYTTGHWDNYKRHQRKHGHDTEKNLQTSTTLWKLGNEAQCQNPEISL